MPTVPACEDNTYLVLARTQSPFSGQEDSLHGGQDTALELMIRMEEFPYNLLEAVVSTIVGAIHSGCFIKVLPIKVTRLDADGFNVSFCIFWARHKGTLGFCANVAGKCNFLPRVSRRAALHPIRQVGHVLGVKEHPETPSSSSFLLVPLIAAGASLAPPVLSCRKG